MNDLYDLGIPHPVTPYPKLIINAAITGMIPTRKNSPHVPLSPKEIIEDAVRCIRAGASIVHLHARDEDGEPTYRKELYEGMILGIRERCPEAILCVSTSGRRHNSFDCRSAPLELEGKAKPDMGSLTLGSLNFPEQASVNTPEMIEALALKMSERGIVPEIEAFEPGMIHAVKVLMLRGVLTGPLYVNILLGSLYASPATLLDLSCMVKSLPPLGPLGSGRDRALSTQYEHRRYSYGRTCPGRIGGQSVLRSRPAEPGNQRTVDSARGAAEFGTRSRSGQAVRGAGDAGAPFRPETGSGIPGYGNETV